MNEQQREKALAMLAESKAALIAALDGLSEAQLAWKPAEDRWSVLETLEHVVVVEQFLFSRVHQAVAAGAVEDAAERTAGKAELLERIMVGREGRVQAPPPVLPKGGVAVGELLSRLDVQRSVIEQFVKTTEVDLNAYTADHRFPVFGTLSAYQWLLNISFHTLRHCKQMAETKACEGYPA